MEIIYLSVYISHDQPSYQASFRWMIRQETQFRIPAARDARALPENFASISKRRREYRVHERTYCLACKTKETHAGQHRYAEIISALPARWFFSAASCSRRSTGLVSLRRRSIISTGLTCPKISSWRLRPTISRAPAGWFQSRTTGSRLRSCSDIKPQRLCGATPSCKDVALQPGAPSARPAQATSIFGRDAGPLAVGTTAPCCGNVERFPSIPPDRFLKSGVRLHHDHYRAVTAAEFVGSEAKPKEPLKSERIIGAAPDDPHASRYCEQTGRCRRVERSL